MSWEFTGWCRRIRKRSGGSFSRQTRRACEVLAVDRSGVRYRSIRPDDAAERAAMKAVAAERWRFGYPLAGNGLLANRERRRIHIMLERQGIMMNLKKLRRLYREEKLQVRKRGGRKRALGTRRPMVLPSAANQRWSLEFAARTFGSSVTPLLMAAGSGFWRS